MLQRRYKVFEIFYANFPLQNPRELPIQNRRLPNEIPMLISSRRRGYRLRSKELDAVKRKCQHVPRIMSFRKLIILTPFDNY